MAEVASGWTVDASGRLRRETVHSMKRRCRDWDYRSRCIYMITVELADRRSKALGRLKVVDCEGRWVEPAAAKALGLKPEAICAKVELSELGEIVVACWNEIHKQWPGVSTLGCQVMPDHFHGLIFVEKRQLKTLGNIVGSFKSKSASRIKALAERAEPHAARYGTAGASCSSPRAAKFWADGFVDTIIWRDGQLKAEIDYLADNPYRLAVKTLFPELFRVVGELAVALPGLGSAATGRFAALGNRFLLRRPLAQVQVSRSHFRYRREPKPGGGLKIVRDAKGEPVAELESPEYRERKADLFAAAKHGAVLLSPCVSDGERQIAHEALSAKLKLITMANKGFSKLQKPGGRYCTMCPRKALTSLVSSSAFSSGKRSVESCLRFVLGSAGRRERRRYGTGRAPAAENGGGTVLWRCLALYRRRSRRLAG